MKFIVYKQYFTVRAKIEPTPLGSISYEGEKSRANPRASSYIWMIPKVCKTKSQPHGRPWNKPALGSTLAHVGQFQLRCS